MAQDRSGRSRPRRGIRRTTAIAVLVLLVGAGSAWAAFQALPTSGAQVNSDTASGIDPTKGAEEADVVGGALTAGKVAVPWAIFKQGTAGEPQIFSRSFANGAWTTRGHGTVNGLGQTTFPGSLNFDQTQEGEAPTIDFAGAGRTVPWATWYEETTALGGKEQIFASRFDSAQNKWVFAGQSRGNGATKPPSLNIDTGQDAENPAVVGGATVAGNAPGPWVGWQETIAGGKDQVFVSKPVKLTGTANCPTGTKPAGGAAVGGFCWQQVGVERAEGDTKPSLNVDPTRAGIEPDDAFTGPGDTVPWVIWYEQGPGAFANNEQVFAAKAVAGTTGVHNGDTVDGDFHWQAVGNGTAGQPAQVLDTQAGGCRASAQAQADCSLNKDPAKDAEDPRVAAGTMAAGNPTVPWVVWDEDVNGVKQVFVSRLVGGDHFALVNSGQPLSLGGNDSTRPDITFSGHTPYVSWREKISGAETKGFFGHFVNPANPTFVLDSPGGTAVSAAGLQADVRPPISSGCTANPFNVDGSSCQGGALGTPLFLFTDGLAPAKLFADAYKPDPPVTGGATGTTVSGSVNPEGTPLTRVHFDFGLTSGYGSTTPAQLVGLANAPQTFTAPLGSFAAGSTVHYRAVAQSDFGTFLGGDQTLTIPKNPPPPPPPPHKKKKDKTKPKVKVTFDHVTLHALLTKHPFKTRINVSEKSKVNASLFYAGHRLARKTVRFKHKGTQTLKLSLGRKARNRLRGHKHPRLTLKLVTTDQAGNVRRTSKSKRL